MALTWDPKISLGQIITMAVLLAGGIAAYYGQINATDRQISESTQQLERQIVASREDIKREISDLRIEVKVQESVVNKLQEDLNELENAVRPR